MKFDRRNFLSASMGAALTLAMPAIAQSAGVDYTPISPAQPTEDAAKIEVVEFFSYGCPHCADFNPLLAAWVAKLPSDVVFKKVPITFGRAAWANIARLYYTLEVTGDVARLESDIFKAFIRSAPTCSRSGRLPSGSSRRVSMARSLPKPSIPSA